MCFSGRASSFYRNKSGETYVYRQSVTLVLILPSAIISRQFLEMPRSRIESLLTSFPKLIPANTQHTSVETLDVRYVYQPLEELYILLITNKASNILQDIETLHLFARVVSDLCRSAEEREISRHAFELLGAFDEIVSLGWREQINLMQVKNVLEMESHEEKIQDIISRVGLLLVSSLLSSLSPVKFRTRKQKQRKSSSGAQSNLRSSAASNRDVLAPTPASSLLRISLVAILQYLALRHQPLSTRAFRALHRLPFARLHLKGRV